MPRKNYGRMYWRPEIFLMKGHWKGECGTKKNQQEPSQRTERVTGTVICDRKSF